MNKSSSEKGQVFIILVVGVVGLLGFTALALDGGIIYSARRHAQNGSDASTLAGGGAAGMVLDQVHYEDFECNLADVTSARQAAVASAINRAASNDFIISAGGGLDPNENEVTTECTIFDNGAWEEKYIDIKVKIGDDVKTSLMHFVFPGPVRNVVDSVTRVFPRTPLAYGNAIVSLSENCQGNDGGVTFNGGGNSTISVNGGGIFSNSCLEANGSSLEICADDTPDDDCDGDGKILYNTTYDQSGNPLLDPSPAQVTHKIPTWDVSPPNCSSLPNMGNHNGGGTISPGRYNRIRLPNGTLNMQPGLYCLYEEFTVNGGTLSGQDVTIYMVNGDFTTAGIATTNLDSPPTSCDVLGGTPGCPPSMPGMLIYMAPTNTGTVQIQGDASSSFMGAVYAPTGTIVLGGGSSQMPTANTQLIGHTVEVNGNVSIDINYNGDEVYKEPAKLDLWR